MSTLVEPALESAGFPVSPSFTGFDPGSARLGAATPFGVTFAEPPSPAKGRTSLVGLTWDEEKQTHVWPTAIKRASTDIHFTLHANGEETLDCDSD